MLSYIVYLAVVAFGAYNVYASDAGLLPYKAICVNAAVLALLYAAGVALQLKKKE